MVLHSLLDFAAGLGVSSRLISRELPNGFSIVVRDQTPRLSLWVSGLLSVSLFLVHLSSSGSWRFKRHHRLDQSKNRAPLGSDRGLENEDAGTFPKVH
jgi:hypothetical protein